MGAMEIDAKAPFSRVLFLRERPLRQRLEHVIAYAFTALALLAYLLLPAPEEALAGAPPPAPDAPPPPASAAATAVGVALALGLVACAALFLAQEWFVDWRRRLSFSDAASPLDAASHVFVQHVCALGATALPPRIVRLEFAPAGCAVADAPAAAAAAAAGTMAAVSQRLRQAAPRRFRVNGASYEVWGPTPQGGFRVAPLPVPEAETLAAYLSWGGWPSHATAAATEARFGANRMEVPVPEFFELAWEHAVAPFFVFQVGCVALWCLDEYVWYSLFTLCMLTFMEGMLVSQRIMTARMLRGMRPPLQPVYAYRHGSWVVVKGESLVPLDVISLHHASPLAAPPPAAAPGSAAARPGAPALPAPPPPSQHVPCPADVLLLRGTVVVNEAMLTGESTPQLKEDIGSFLSSDASAALAERLNAFAEDTGDRSHGRSIVYAGTLVMTSNCPPLPPSQAGGASAGGAGGAGGGSRVPPPPDGGCPGIVVRTGPYTSQGELMRSIMGASTGRSAVDRDAFVFLGVMLVFALASSGYVLYAGLADPHRDRWKLVLHCVMIITTVIPPELPVQLSMCTNTSLAILAKRGIFCTEPARIPMSGNVDLVAFDKTGTLTADEFTVQAVVFCAPAAEGKGGSASSSSALTLAAQPLVCDPKACPAAARLVLAGCHALSPVEVPLPPPPAPVIRPAGWVPPPTAYRTELAGEPLEKAALRAIGWTVAKNLVTTPLPPAPAPAAPAAPPAGGAAAGKGAAPASTALAAPAPAPAPADPSEGGSITVLRRWAFSSALRRMTCIVHVAAARSGGAGGAGGGAAGAPGAPALRAPSSPALPPALQPLDAAVQGGHCYVVCKGAPEAIEGLLARSALPPHYTATHSSLSASSNRVLALAYKRLELPGGGAAGAAAAAGALAREEAEGGLTFAGFVVASCALKTDSERTVRELQAASVRVVMITGDAALTAAAVARQLGMGPEGAPQRAVYSIDECPTAADAIQCALILEAVAGGEAGAGAPPPAPLVVFKPSVLAVAASAPLPSLPPPGSLVCVTGRALARAREHGGPLALARLCALCTVFARVSPSQKELIVGVLEEGDAVHGYAPRQTAMVGDGSNDTGALKRARVGLAIISNPEMERKYDDARLRERAKREEALAKQLAEGAKWGPAFVDALRKAHAARLAEDEAEDESAELGALLRPERERVAALGLGTGEGGAAGGGGFLDAAMASAKAMAEKQVAAAAAAAEAEAARAGAAGAVAGAGGGSTGAPTAAATAATAQLEEMQRRLAEMQAETGEGGLGGPMVAALGDASMAAPLTSKFPTPLSIVEVLRQGRCTLVTTHTMFKILAVNSLTASYTLSVLYLNDVKTGDSQATFAGMFGSALFFAISFAKPLRRLSVERPSNRVLNRRLIATVCLQTCCHVLGLVIAAHLAGGYVPEVRGPGGVGGAGGAGGAGGGGGAAALTPESFALDEAGVAGGLGAAAAGLAGAAAEAVGGAAKSAAEKLLAGLSEGEAAAAAAAAAASESWFSALSTPSSFRPNAVNTAVWLLTTASQTATFVTSYHGEPFMAPLSRATTLSYGTLAVYCVTVVGALGVSSDLNSYFQLVPLPTAAARQLLALLIVADGLLCFFVDRLIRRYL